MIERYCVEPTDMTMLDGLGFMAGTLVMFALLIWFTIWAFNHYD